MDLILSRLGAKKEGNTHTFYPLMLPPGTIAQDKPVAKIESDIWPDPDVPSCKTEIDNDVAVLMETHENIPTCVKTEPDEPEVIKLENDACNEPPNSVNPIDSVPVNSDLLIDPRKSIGASVMVKEKPKRKMAKSIQYKNYAQNQARSLKLLSIKPFVAKRGKGIPLEIRREIAKIFKAHGFDKSSKREAQKLYQERTNSADVLHR